MKQVPYRLSLVFSAVALLSACQPATEEAATQEPGAVEAVAADTIEQLVPLPGLEADVPVLTQKTRITMQTTAGDVVIDVYPEAAPNAAQRFVELVQSGFYDNTPVSRIVPGFVAQFGINWREGHRDWQERNFDDDPTLFALERGTLAFAKAGPNTNSTQVFINYQENNQLAVPQYNFTVFGKVAEGMEIVDSFVQVGDPGGGLDQGRLWADGEAYLAEQAVQPSMILSATVTGTTP
jgi:peptidyl-prolyl cis-trans isomerase A (cyclophilin A)